MRPNTATDYLSERYALLKRAEGEMLYAYVDTKYPKTGQGVPHIGIGINLSIQTHAYLLLETLGFDTAGKVLTGKALTAEKAYAQRLVAALRDVYRSDVTTKNDALATANRILQERLADLTSGYPNGFVRRNYFSISFDESRQLFDSLMSGYSVPVLNNGQVVASTFTGYETTLNDWLDSNGISDAALRTQTSKE